MNAGTHALAALLSLLSGLAHAAGTVTGTGFAVSPTGHILTNDHVAGSCSEVALQLGQTSLGNASVVARDPRNDLALLKSSQTFPAFAAFRGGPVRAGESVVALGYPYRGLLASDANVSVGIVSALAGLRNDTSQLQISAPVQPGNSGGPLLDSGGAVVGVVVAKLDALAVAKLSGDIPQNVNFAVRGELAAAFLRANGVEPRVASGASRTQQAADVAEAARRFTVLIECDPLKRQRDEAAQIAAARELREAQETQRRAEDQRRQREESERREAAEAAASAAASSRREAAERERERLQAEIDRTLRLSLPVRCELGEQCLLTVLFRHNGESDYLCGTKTSTTIMNRATGFRLFGEWRTRGGIPVVAAADGVIQSSSDTEVVLDHGGGWSTIYQRFSASKDRAPNTPVKQGDPLGYLPPWVDGRENQRFFVFYVRRNGEFLDPFTGAGMSNCGQSAASRWTTEAESQLLPHTRTRVDIIRLVEERPDLEKRFMDEYPAAQPGRAGFIVGQVSAVEVGDVLLISHLSPGSTTPTEQRLKVGKNAAMQSFYVSSGGSLLSSLLRGLAPREGKHVVEVKVIRRGVEVAKREVVVEQK